jgi:hypothetical protein
MDNRLVMLETHLNELHTEINNLVSTNKALTETLKELFSLAKDYVPNEKLSSIMDKLHKPTQ